MIAEGDVNEATSAAGFDLSDLRNLSVGLRAVLVHYDEVQAAEVAAGAPWYSSDSPAAADVSAGAPEDVVLELLASVNLKVAAALEHSETLLSFASKAVANQPSPYFAPFSIGRSAVESATLACWLLETGITPTERAGRQLSVEWQEILNQEKLGGNDLAGAKLETEQTALSLELAKVGKGASAGFGQGFPNRTNLAERVLRPEAYRILSGASHGDTWATVVIGYAPTGLDSAQGQVAKKSQLVGVYMLPMLWSLQALARCYWLDSTYRGRDVLKLEDKLDDSYDLAGIASDSRFWTK